MEVSAMDTGGEAPATPSAHWGIFGGTFDPPHLGHEAAIRASQLTLGLSEVRVMVAGDPWQKSAKGQTVSRASDRLAMALLAFGHMAGVTIDDSEIMRDGPTYAIDTLEALEHPGRSLVLILGADAAAGLPSWHRHDDLPRRAELAVVSRAGCPVDLPQEVTSMWKVHQVVMEPVGWSSSEVRQRLVEGHSVAGMVRQPVMDYAHAHGLYRERRDRS
jgi:nicotinate-nucleotide adenylyltransferase